MKRQVSVHNILVHLDVYMRPVNFLQAAYRAYSSMVCQCGIQGGVSEGVHVSQRLFNTIVGLHFKA